MDEKVACRERREGAVDIVSVRYADYANGVDV